MSPLRKTSSRLTRQDGGLAVPSYRDTLYPRWARTSPGQWASPGQPFITMGRKGESAPILKAIIRERLTSEAFILGPDLPDISSTAARMALRRADVATLEACLHPGVAAWLSQHGPYQPASDVANSLGSSSEPAPTASPSSS